MERATATDEHLAPQDVFQTIAALVAFAGLVVIWLACLAIPLYALVRFVKWAWMQ